MMIEISLEQYNDMAERLAELEWKLGEAEQRWIPCSERLPNESGWYVISVVGFENITDVSYFYSDEAKWSDVSHTQSVVAWMPLPTPYKGGADMRGGGPE